MKLVAICEFRGGSLDGAEIAIMVPPGAQTPPARLWLVREARGACLVEAPVAPSEPYHFEPGACVYRAGPLPIDELPVHLPPTPQPLSAAEQESMTTAPPLPFPPDPYATPRLVRWACLIAWALVLLAVLTSVLRAQDLGSVRVVNRTPYRHRMLATCGLVFPPGAVEALPGGLCALKATSEPLGLQGWPSAVQAFGQRWPDGSVRHGRLLAVPRVPGNTDEQYPVGPAPELPIVLGEWCARLAGAIAPRLTLVRADGSRIVSSVTREGANLSVSPAGVVSQVTQRIPGTCLWWSLRTEIGCDSDAIRFRLRIHNSDPSRPTVREDWQELRFDSDLPAQFWLRDRLGLVPTPAPGLYGPASSISWRLSRADWLADGQGLWIWDGVFPLIDPNHHPADEVERVEALQAAATWPIEMAHTGFATPGLFGPFGTPGRIAEGRTLTSTDQDITNRALSFARSGTEIARWGEWSFSEFADTARTGEHPTHGTALLAGEMLTANPRVIPELLLGCLGQARRPLYRYESDLRIVLKRNHPQLTLWSGNVHWVSVDRLGKGTAQATEADKHFWSGPDPEHWMMESFLGPAALWTADWDLIEMGRHHMEQLKGHGYGQLGNFATRAQAWTSYAMAWWLLALGESEDATWVRGWQDWMATWHTRKDSRGEGGWGAGPGPVRPTIVMRDPRYFWHPAGVPLKPDGTPDPLLCQPFWIVWQAHFLAWGGLALHRVQPHAGLLAVTTHVARTVDMYGWDSTRKAPYGGVAWMAGGAPIGSVDYVQDVWDPVGQRWTKTVGTVTSSAQTDWGIWAAGALGASEHLASLGGGDAAWLQQLALIRTWIDGYATNQVSRDKMARWSGSVPTAVVLR